MGGAAKSCNFPTGKNDHAINCFYFDIIIRHSRGLGSLFCITPMGIKIAILPLKLLQNWVFLTFRFVFLKENLQTKREFSDWLKFGLSPCYHVCHFVDLTRWKCFNPWEMTDYVYDIILICTPAFATSGKNVSSWKIWENILWMEVRGSTCSILCVLITPLVVGQPYMRLSVAHRAWSHQTSPLSSATSLSTL